MLACRRELDNGRQKPEIMVMTSLRRRAIYRHHSDHLANLLTLNPKPKSGAGRYQLLPRCGDVNGKQLGLKDFSPKSQDAVALQQIDECGAYLHRRYPSGNRLLQQYLLHWPGAGYGQFEHKADSLIAKFKEAGGTVREIDV